MAIRFDLYDHYTHQPIGDWLIDWYRERGGREREREGGEREGTGDKESKRDIKIDRQTN